MNRKLVTLILLVACGVLASTAARASTEILSRDYGFNGEDDTDALQSAIRNTTADTLVIDQQASAWIVRPLLFINRKDLVIVFAPGVTVQQKRGAFGDRDQMFRFIQCENIAILGYGATVRMFREDFSSEFAHAFQINASVNFRIEGLTIRGSGGDGIIVTRREVDGQSVPSRNITIRNCWLDQNRRQGISIINVEGLLIEGCRMSNTRGTLPQSGIDFESDRPDETFKNCVVRNCLIDGNAGRGIQLGLGKVDVNSEPIDITFEDVVVRGNGTNQISGRWGGITYNGGQEGVTGEVVLRRVLFEDEPAYGVRLTAADGNLAFTFDNCIWRNVGNEYQTSGEASTYVPVYIERRITSGSPAIGNVAFNNCVVEDDIDRPTLIIDNRGDEPISDITGNLTVINPALSSEPFDLGPSAVQTNVTIQGAVLSEWPASTYSLTTPDATAAEGGQGGRFVVNQSGDALPLPKPIYYTLSGSSANRTDYSGLPEAQIVAGGTGQATIVVDAVADFQEDEESETVVLDLTENSAYSLEGTTQGTVTIDGSDPSEPDPTDDGLGVTVRARGRQGGEQFQLFFNGNAVGNVRTVSQEYEDYVFNQVPSEGTYRVAYLNDTVPELDLQVDYLRARGITLQAEDQLVNTGAWNGAAQACGGIQSEWLNCAGYIEFTGLEAPSGTLVTLDADQPNVWPNPASSQDQVQLQFTVERASTAQVLVHDAQGRRVWSVRIATRRGTNRVAIPVQQLDPGVYSVSTDQADSPLATARLLVQ